MKELCLFILLGIAMVTEAIEFSSSSVSKSDHHRFRRFLIFPASAPTRMQLIAGIGIPVDLEYESVTIGYVLKSEYFLPDNTSTVLHFLRDPFDPLQRPIERRRRNVITDANDSKNNKIDRTDNETDADISNSNSKDHYEKYDVEAVQIGTGLMNNDRVDEYDSTYDGDWNQEDEEYSAADYRITKQNDFATARWTLYKGIETMADRKGLAGHSCMLRSICESAHAPFSFSSGIIAELMHIIMTPSSSKDTLIDHSLNEYYHAEEIGKSGAPCGNVFRECTISVLDKFSGIYHTMENIVKMLG